MLKAGASKVNITPFLGGPMAGYSARDRGSESIHDELHAKALVLDDGKTGVALITTDLIGIDRELAAHVRRLVEADVGLGPDRVWMTGSHTHFGPAVRTGGTADEHTEPYDRSYADVLAAKLATAVKIAHDRLRPARLGAGSIRAEGISYNRRLIRHDGKVQMSLTLPPPYEGLKFRPMDPEVGVLKVEGEADGDTIASLVNFACHPVSSTDRTYEITADYPGYAMDLIESVEGGTCLFALGCAGNIVPIQRQGRSKRQVGLSLGGCALKALQWIQTTDGHRIRASRKTIELPLRRFPSAARMEQRIADAEAVLNSAMKRKAPSREITVCREALGLARSLPRWAERFGRRRTRPTEIQVFWIGDIPMIGLPGEVFVELGLRVKKALNASPALVVSLSNDSAGYIPVRRAYREGGYESNVSPFAPGCGEHLVREALDLAESIR
ncbi:MAG: neutral/alkaline non-lysosomal ceramidase N-terminal domain-containing protein [Gemmatimonadota bacterium]|nr:neutral/alkaline non-lysosomal ceramidase N-terminal domain-containing protein [Gemmatimonadota bacterium]